MSKRYITLVLSTRPVVAGLVAFLWFFSDAYAQVGTSVSYHPPIVPISISIDNESKVHFELTGSMEIPLIGTFSIGAQKLSVEAANTYFLVRRNNTEKLYCIGTRGKLRLQAKGVHEIELSTLERYPNVITIDVKSQSGTIKLDFVPDETSDEIAKIRKGNLDLILKKNGVIMLDGPFGNDKYVNKSDIQRFLFTDLPKHDIAAIAFEYSGKKDEETGQKSFWTWMVCEKQQRIEALWFKECVNRLEIVRVKELELEKSFKDNLFIFKTDFLIMRVLDDGMKLRLVPYNRIKDIKYEESGLFNLHVDTIIIDCYYNFNTWEGNKYNVYYADKNDQLSFVNIIRRKL